MLGPKIYVQQPLHAFGLWRTTPSRTPFGTVCATDRESSPKSAKPKPFWVKDLEADAPFDADAARVLKDTDGDVDKIRANMRAEREKKQQEIWQERLGADKPMSVHIRDVNPFDLWLWFELWSRPSVSEVGLLSEALRSWFIVGRMGGFNSTNMQLAYHSQDDISFFEYDSDACESTMESFLHGMGEVETNGEWCRTWVDLGTADEGCLDVLINMLSTFSFDYVGIKRLYIGGENDDWPIPQEDGDGAKKATMDPMEIRKTAIEEELDEELDLSKGFSIEDIEKALSGSNRGEKRN